MTANEAEARTIEHERHGSGALIAFKPQVVFQFQLSVSSL